MSVLVTMLDWQMYPNGHVLCCAGAEHTRAACVDGSTYVTAPPVHPNATAQHRATPSAFVRHTYGCGQAEAPNEHTRM